VRALPIEEGLPLAQLVAEAGALAAKGLALQVALALPDQDLVDGVERQPEAVLADELDAQALDPEPHSLRPPGLV
jgi:hypothetical protein